MPKGDMPIRVRDYEKIELERLQRLDLQLMEQIKMVEARIEELKRNVSGQGVLPGFDGSMATG